MINKKFFPYLGPLLSGVIIGAVILILKPNTGKNLGDAIYSSRVAVESYSYAVNRAAPSVVNIYVANLNEDYTKPDTNEIFSSASGVVMAKNTIITNYHVVPLGSEDNKAVWVQSRDGKLYHAFIVGADRRTDLAVLKVEDSDLSAITISKSSPNLGDIVLAIGNPINLGQTVTHGIVSALARSGTGLLTNDKMTIRQGVQELIQTDAPINQGNSGGALINTKGELIGINTASFSGENTYGIGFSVPVNLVVKVMDEIKLHGRVIRGYLGISDAEAGVLKEQDGVTVGYIDPQGPAFGILKVGDIITKVDDINIPNVKALIDLISQSRPGAKLSFTIIRDNNEQVEEIILAEDQSTVD